MSLVVMMDSEIKLFKVFFCGNTHIKLKVGLINASTSKGCESTFLKKQNISKIVDFDQFFSDET